MTSDTVWDLKRRPDALAVLGGGAIGCELAQAFGRLGSQVTLIEAAERLLPGEEPRAGELVAARLYSEGVSVWCGARAGPIRGARAGGEIRVEPRNGSGQAPTTIGFERLLVAVGRTPSTRELGLDRVGVLTDARGAVRVDRRLRTSASHVYAVGDVTGQMAFTTSPPSMPGWRRSVRCSGPGAAPTTRPFRASHSPIPRSPASGSPRPRRGPGGGTRFSCPRLCRA